MANTLNKHIRVDEDDWKRIEEEARKRGVSPNRLVIASTLEAIDSPRWPRTEAEIYLLRSAMFAAQAIARDMAAAGRSSRSPATSPRSPRNCRPTRPRTCSLPRTPVPVRRDHMPRTHDTRTVPKGLAGS